MHHRDFVNVCLFCFFVVASSLPYSFKVPLQLQYIGSYIHCNILGHISSWKTFIIVVTDAVIHIIVVVVCSCSSCCFCKCCRYTDCALPPECPQVPVGLPGKVGTSAQVLVEGATIPVHTNSRVPQSKSTLLWPQHGQHSALCSTTLLAPPPKSAGTQVQHPSFSRAGLSLTPELTWPSVQQTMSFSLSKCPYHEQSAIIAVHTLS